ncbi:MAG TPA: metal ABC transporter permease [Spirochaetia bacterium]|nr:metal ABC transporter permease [Spirochaetia bacterium]
MLNSGLFTETFMVHAWISGTMVAILSAFVGFFVVIRGSAFVAHALPKAGFAGAAGAVLLGVNPLYGLSLFAVGGALLIGWIGKRERNDVITALTLVAALGTGALFLALTNGYASGAYALLFGQIVGVSAPQVADTAVLGFVCLLGIAFLYRPLLLASISQEIAQSRGVPVRLVEMAFLVVVGLAAAITVPVVGALLCFSLLIGPTAASSYLTCHPGKALVLALLFSLVTVWTSLVLAFFSGWPIGFFVSIIVGLLYICSRAVGFRYSGGNRLVRHREPAGAVR